MMTVTEKEMQDGNQKRKVWACNFCGKEGKRENMKMHIVVERLKDLIDKE